MPIDSFMPTEIISGKGAMAKATQSIARLGSRCLIITGGSSAVKSGALADAEKALTEYSISFDVFAKIEPNPLTSTCCEAGKAAREFGADFLIGIGGGSPLDTVKAAALYAADPTLTPDDIYLRDIEKSRPLPTVLVGTTAGTGSEVTGVSVLTQTKNGRKKSISGKDCYGRIAVCDYSYTMSAPRGVSVSTALDAFAHAAESFLSLAANEISSLYALKALPMIWDGLKVLSGSDTVPEEIYEKLYTGSIFAGLAINITGTLFPHTTGYYLTEEHGIPHGRACAAFAPTLFDIYEKYAPAKLSALEKALASSKDEIVTLIKNLNGINIALTEEEAREVSARWKNAAVKNFDRTPGGFTYKDAEEALLRLSQG